MGVVCDKYCWDCKYYCGEKTYVKYCGYLFATGKPRPCNPGTGCTAKIKRKKRSARDEIHGIG